MLVLCAELCRPEQQQYKGQHFGAQQIVPCSFRCLLFAVQFVLWFLSSACVFLFASLGLRLTYALRLLIYYSLWCVCVCVCVYFFLQSIQVQWQRLMMISSLSFSLHCFLSFLLYFFLLPTSNLSCSALHAFVSFASYSVLIFLLCVFARCRSASLLDLLPHTHTHRSIHRVVLLMWCARKLSSVIRRTTCAHPCIHVSV